MKDPADKVTAKLPLNMTGKERQAAYAARHRAAGRAQVTIWVTTAEKQAVLELLERLRADKSR